MNNISKLVFPAIAAVLLLTTPSLQAQIATHKYKMPQVNCVSAKLPLTLSEVHFDGKHKEMPAQAVDKVKEILTAFYLEMGGDRNEQWTKIKDSYFATVRVPFYHYHLYIVILLTPPPVLTHCKLFLYDPTSQTVSAHAIDYNTWAMYTIENKRMTPTKLIKKLPMIPPDIAASGSKEYPSIDVIRLYHNGTVNQKEEITYLANGTQLDTFSFHQRHLK